MIRSGAVGLRWVPKHAVRPFVRFVSSGDNSLAEMLAKSASFKAKPNKYNKFSRNERKEGRFSKMGQQGLPQDAVKSYSRFKIVGDNKGVVWESQDLTENEYMNETIRKVLDNDNRAGSVWYINEFGKREETTIFDVLVRLDEVQAGKKEYDLIKLIHVTDSRPLVKKFNRNEAMAEFKERIFARNDKLYGRTKEKKRESNLKFVKLGWEMSLSDLKNQKTKEILTHLKKGYRVRIGISVKKFLNSKKFSWNEKQFVESFKDRFKKPDELEMLKRTKMMEYLDGLFEGHAEIKQRVGELEHGFLYELQPKKAAT